MIRLTRKVKLRPELVSELAGLKGAMSELQAAVHGGNRKPASVERQTEGSRPMPHGWWIVPGTLVSLVLWLAFFRLVGVL